MMVWDGTWPAGRIVGTLLTEGEVLIRTPEVVAAGDGVILSVWEPLPTDALGRIDATVPATDGWEYEVQIIPRGGETVTGSLAVPRDTTVGLAAAFGVSPGIPQVLAAGAPITWLTPAQREWLTGPWRTVWRDDFSGTTLDPRWRTDGYAWGRSNHNNGEHQWYTDESVTLTGGVCRLTARRTPTEGTIYGVTRQYDYTSGMISTRDRFAFPYGRVDVRATLPAGGVMWPAIWMMPASGAWPPELDIVELYGDASYIEQTVHWGTPEAHEKDSVRVERGGLTDWHTWSLAWQPGLVVWMLDGEVTRAYWGTFPGDWFLMVNLAVGSDWMGAPGPTTPDTATLDVDSVTVSRKP